MMVIDLENLLTEWTCIACSHGAVLNLNPLLEILEIHSTQSVLEIKIKHLIHKNWKKIPTNNRNTK